MNQVLIIAQIVLSIAIVTLILIQAKGTGLGQAFGGMGGNFSTRRGVEKTVFYLTIGVAVLFFLSSVVQLLTI